MLAFLSAYRNLIDVDLEAHRPAALGPDPPHSSAQDTLATLHDEAVAPSHVGAPNSHTRDSYTLQRSQLSTELSTELSTKNYVIKAR